MLKLRATHTQDQVRLNCGGQPDRCAGCSLNATNGGRCKGCTPSKLAACQQRRCDGACASCGGYNVDVPAICIKSPVLRPTLVQAGGRAFAAPVFNFRKQEPIRFNCRGIVTARGGGVKLTKEAPYLDEMDAVSTSVADVWSRKGFHSKDLKDYLRIPASKKLILLTTAKDDILDAMWDMEAFGGEEFAAAGIDYWMPIIYSMYEYDAHANRYWQTIRTFKALERGAAHFTPTCSFNNDDWIQQAAKAIPQIIFNAQFLSVDGVLQKLLRRAAHWHTTLPKDVAVFTVGSATPTFCHNLKRVTGDRPRFYISANPFRCAAHGKELKVSGKQVKNPNYSREELIYVNQRAFLQTIKKWG